ncbi:MAG TPA: LPS assembly lipoprotein LptE [Devosia sp.]|nr:LPS assembly lipoprotein LptE [Devosia sp.]
MSSSRRMVRTLGVCAALLAAPLLAACSGFTPVYGTGGVTSQKIEIAFGQPGNRTEQIIYQDLRLRLGQAAGPAPRLTVHTDVASRQLTDTSNVVSTMQRPEQVTVTAYITLTDQNGNTLFSGTRSETADYNGSSQVTSNNQAARDAAERAAHLLADTIRLTVLGALA